MTMRARFSGKRVLITGGLGFIGSTLARQLADLGAQVTLVDNMLPNYGGNLFNIAGYEERLRVNIADVRDPYSMSYLIQGQDFLFNLAGQTSHLDSMQDPYTDLEINCRSQLSILEACRNHNPGVRVLYASTRQLYGKPQRLPVDEAHLLQPVDVNGINKMAGEWYHILYNNVYGIRCTSLRLTNTYGPRMRVRDARQTFLGIWLRRLIEAKPILVYGDGTQKRDLNYVSDVIEAMLLAVTNEHAFGRVFNLGSEEVVSLYELAQLLVELNNGGEISLVPFPTDRKAIDIGDYYGDFRRAKEELGWTPRFALRDGLATALEYYRKFGSEFYWQNQ
jgi:UDP-glucose 4-epimerase